MPEKRTIAVIDDHTMFRKGLKTLINYFINYEVMLEASNGKDFIAQVNAKKLPDIVLMDINMPEMDGYETAAWLLNNYPNVRVLALSTMDADTAIIKMIKSGARGYVLKDAEPDELNTALDEVMSRGYYYNELITSKVLMVVRDIIEDKKDVATFIKLTDRETEFLKYACTEMTYKEIADKMIVGVRTVEGYRDNLCQKLDLKTRTGLAMYAIKNQIVSLPDL